MFTVSYLKFKIDDDYSYNVFELDAASNNGVDDIRNLIEQTRIPPQKGNYKVYIIDEVHMLSAGAFNAFLKTLEEPSDSSIFILTSSGKFWSHARDDSILGVLSTIKSRCRRIFIDTDIEIKFNFSKKIL